MDKLKQETFQSGIKKLKETDWSDPLIADTVFNVLRTAIQLTGAEAGIIAVPDLKTEPPLLEVVFGIRCKAGMINGADSPNKHKITVLGAMLGDGLAEIRLQVPGGRSFSPEHPRIIQTYSESAAFHLRGAISHSRERRERTAQTFMAMAAMTETMENVSEWTAGHSVRVSQIGGEIAREVIDNDFVLSGEERAKLETLIMNGGFAIHDIGKIGVPYNIIESPNSLSDEEKKEVNRHCEYAKSILEWIDGFGGESADISNVALYHHEHWDGKGYFGLSGEEIPLAARVISIADAYDAMISLRPYRSNPKSPVEAARVIWSERGKQFDPRVVEIGFKPWFLRQFPPNAENHNPFV